ncbi:hypothetical protein BSU04_35215 [Caballeronia sordidicola]|uniref:Uncharacterized protein n=1 Tax=Caballeronia sordidicola TaxID=196367 RepID=A0A226WRL6_CABSO|nr:hypothetical protein BSU04_35215 [Caballeronia sordidicola]
MLILKSGNCLLACLFLSTRSLRTRQKRAIEFKRRRDACSKVSVLFQSITLVRRAEDFGHSVKSLRTSAYARPQA